MVLSRTGFYQTSSDQGSSGASEARTQSTELTLARATPHINRVLTASGTYSPCGGNTRGSETHGLAYVGANPRPQCRAHATRFGRRRLRFASLAWIGSGAASGTAARQRAAGCSVCRLQRDCAQVALGCNTVHVVATHCAALLRHTCVAQRQMSRRAAVAAQMSAGDGFGCGADVGRPGMDSFAVQRWARDRLGPVADVGGGWTWSRCRCGRV